MKLQQQVKTNQVIAAGFVPIQVFSVSLNGVCIPSLTRCVLTAFVSDLNSYLDRISGGKCDPIPYPTVSGALKKTNYWKRDIDTGNGMPMSLCITSGWLSLNDLTGKSCDLITSTTAHNDQ